MVVGRKLTTDNMLIGKAKLYKWWDSDPSCVEAESLKIKNCRSKFVLLLY